MASDVTVLQYLMHYPFLSSDVCTTRGRTPML